MNEDILIQKWLEGTLTAEEWTVFQAREDYPELEQLRAETDTWNVPAADYEAMLNQVLASKEKSSGARILGMPRWSLLAIAASIVLLVAFFLWPQQQNQWTTVQAMAGESIRGSLPDGSTYRLNAGSTLEVGAGNWEQERLLRLSGEAWFDVETGAEFRVETSLGSVTVLGTQFNVRERDSILEVTCQEGRVRVANTAGQVLGDLQAGQGIRTVAGELDTLPEGSTRLPDWTRGIFRFHNAPLADVLAELERQFDVNIQPGTADLQTRLTCNFQKDDLELALKTTVGTLEISFVIQGDVVILE